MEALEPILVCLSRRHWLAHDAMMGIARYARTHTRWSIISTDTESKPFVSPLKLGARAAIVCVQDADLQRFLDDRIPVVALETRQGGGVCPCVQVDNHAVGRTSAEYFIGLGHRRFGYVPSGKWVHDARQRGFSERIAEEPGCGLDVFAGGLQLGEHSHDESLAALTGWLERLARPIAVLACNDRHGVTVLRAARQAGLRVPEEVAVLGVHNELMYCEMEEVALSSVAIAGERMGYESARLLHEQLSGRPVEARPVWVAPVGVVTRRSTDHHAVTDSEVLRALEWIGGHLTERFTIEHLLDAMAISRSSLERRFKLSLGRSPHEEILRQRLECARRLLLNGDLDLKRIASACGFSCSQYFGNVFKKRIGQSPAMYRQQFGKG